jgi:hypothetical protein
VTSKFVALIYQSWADLDRAVEELSQEEATTRSHGGSAIAWTVAHATTTVDSWLNVGFQGLPPDPIIHQSDFWTGGSGDASDWPSIRKAVERTRGTAREFLDAKSDADLDTVIPYGGSIPLLRKSGLQLRYALMAIACHHWIHMGEILTNRSRLGWQEPSIEDWGRTLL